LTSKTSRRRFPDLLRSAFAVSHDLGGLLLLKPLWHFSATRARGVRPPAPLPAHQTSVRNPKLSQRCCSGTVPDTHLHNTGGRYLSKKFPDSIPFEPAPSSLNTTSDGQPRYPQSFRSASRSLRNASRHLRSASRTPQHTFHITLARFYAPEGLLHLTSAQLPKHPAPFSHHVYAASRPRRIVLQRFCSASRTQKTSYPHHFGSVLRILETVPLTFRSASKRV
jgi:hypothetical protein